MNDNELLIKIKEIKKKKTRVLLAADGMCGSGKTTWAEAFACEKGFSLVHIDDFFPAKGQWKYDVAVDLDRVLNEVILPFEHSEPVVFRPFNCARQTLEAPVTVPDSDVLLLEGVYSMHPMLRAHYDLMLFFEIDAEEQRRRILARNGEELLRRFIDEWIPNENRYFEKYHVREAAIAFSAKQP